MTSNTADRNYFQIINRNIVLFVISFHIKIFEYKPSTDPRHTHDTTRFFINSLPRYNRDTPATCRYIKSCSFVLFICLNVKKKT